MKTAEEWEATRWDLIQTGMTLRQWIEAIQSDAKAIGRAEGMREDEADKKRMDFLQQRYSEDLKRNPDIAIASVILDANFESIRNAIDAQIAAIDRKEGMTNE